MVMVINKTDLAPNVGASLAVMQRDAARMRGERPFVFASLNVQHDLAEILQHIGELGGLDLRARIPAHV